MIIRWNWSTVPHVGVQIHSVSYHCCFYLPSYPSLYIPPTFGIKWLVSYPHLWVFLGYLKPSCCFSPGFYHQMFPLGNPSHPSRTWPRSARHLGCPGVPNCVTDSPQICGTWFSGMAFTDCTATCGWDAEIPGFFGVNPLQTRSLSIECGCFRTLDV